MDQTQTFLCVVGVITCTVGAFAVLGLIMWQGTEWWINFRQLRGPLMRFYADELRRRALEREDRE